MEPHDGMATPPSGRRRPSEAAPSIQVQQPPDIVSLTHLRWDFVFQRPQHLLTRCARRHRVFVVEEPVIDDGPPRLDVSVRQHGIHVVVPRFPARPPGESAALQAQLLRGFFRDHRIADYVLWYYTPMALEFTRDLDPARRRLRLHGRAVGVRRRARRAARARTGAVGRAPTSSSPAARPCTRASAHSHPNVHAFPSSVDVAHFARAPSAAAGPRRSGAHPASAARASSASSTSAWTIDAAAAGSRRRGRIGTWCSSARSSRSIRPTLPRAANIHYLGPKPYDELPAYIAGWDVALLPFARNEATRFISPTKTPEYLAAGKPVVSTSIRDVVRPYGIAGAGAHRRRRRTSSSRRSKRRSPRMRPNACARSTPSSRRPRGTAPGPACTGWSRGDDGDERGRRRLAAGRRSGVA